MSLHVSTFPVTFTPSTSSSDYIVSLEVDLQASTGIQIQLRQCMCVFVRVWKLVVTKFQVKNNPISDIQALLAVRPSSLAVEIKGAYVAMDTKLST